MSCLLIDNPFSLDSDEKTNRHSFYTDKSGFYQYKDYAWETTTNYLPEYEALFKKLQGDDERRRHQAQQRGIENQSIYESLTPETVAKIRSARGKKDEISTPVPSINPFYKAATQQSLNRKQSPQETATVQETETRRSEETAPIVEGLD